MCGDRLDERRLDEEAGAVEHLAAVEDPAALFERDLERLAVVASTAFLSTSGPISVAGSAGSPMRIER